MKKLGIGVDLEAKRVNDMTFDLQGERLAMIVDFHRIIIVEFSNKGNTYEKKMDRTLNYGVLKIKWGHPKQGNFLAASTCLKTIVIMQKKRAPSRKDQNEYSFKESQDLRENIMEIKFLPRQQERRLSVGFFDGKVSIYSIKEDEFGNLHLLPINTLDVSSCPVYCLSWSKDHQNSLMFAAGMHIKVGIPSEC